MKIKRLEIGIEYDQIEGGRWVDKRRTWFDSRQPLATMLQRAVETMYAQEQRVDFRNQSLVWRVAETQPLPIQGKDGERLAFLNGLLTHEWAALGRAEPEPEPERPTTHDWYLVFYSNKESPQVNYLLRDLNHTEAEVEARRIREERHRSQAWSITQLRDP